MRPAIEIKQVKRINFPQLDIEVNGLCDTLIDRIQCSWLFVFTFAVCIVHHVFKIHEELNLHPVYFVELSIILDSLSLAVPRPDISMRTLRREESSSANHFGTSTAIRGKKAACTMQLCSGFAKDSSNSLLSSRRNLKDFMSETVTGWLRKLKPTGTVPCEGSFNIGYSPLEPEIRREKFG